jgi:hypothetical protein
VTVHVCLPVMHREADMQLDAEMQPRSRTRGTRRPEPHNAIVMLWTRCVMLSNLQLLLDGDPKGSE